MKSILLTTAALTVLATGAMAADAVAKLPAASMYNWTGAYVGAQIGYAASGKIDTLYVFDSRYDYRYTPKGLFGGLYGGYNYQIDGGVVLGVEADINGGDVKAAGRSTGGYRSTSKLDRTGSGRVRVGYAFDRVLPFVTGGVALGHYRFEETGPFTSKASKTLTGWTVGTGAEYAVTDSWIVRGEYRYTDFGKKSFVSSSNEDWTTKIRTHDLRIGAAYKF